MKHKTAENIELVRDHAQARVALAFHIAKRRLSLGITQENLADKMGLSRTSVVNIEQGRQGIAVESLPTIAKALKWSVTQLVSCL